MFKVFIRGNKFIIDDLERNLEYEAHAKNVLVRRLSPNSDVFTIENVKDWSEKKQININQIIKEDNVLYTLQEFIDFESNETGFNGGKRPPTPTEITYTGGLQVFDLASEKVKQVFVQGVLTRQFTITGLTIYFDEALNINNKIIIFYGT